jgi:signal transduction histidine kinase
VKTTLRARLALSYLALILVGMAVIAPLAWLAVERLYRGAQEANLLAQARLIAAALSEGPLPGAGAEPGIYSQTANLSPGIHTRVIDAQGAAVIDLYGQPEAGEALALPALAQNAAGQVTPDELLSRPEIARARSGEAAAATRRVELPGGEAGGAPVLYAAVPVVDASGQVVRIVYLATPLPDTRWGALPAGVRWQFGGAILAAALLAGAAGWMLARRIARPLSRLAAAAQQVAGGDLDQRVPEDPAIHELGVLSRAFNHMTAALRQSDQAKNAFIADVSHELRTPLTVIKGTIETLQDGALDDLEARGPFLESMSRETERLIRLVNDLLVLARADAGALNLRRQQLDLAALARSRCEVLRPAAARRQVRLEVRECPGPDGPLDPRIQADPDRLAQVLDNLLDNAVRHSPPGGLVEVILERQGEALLCRFADQGPGIAPQHLPFLFDRFYRADPSRERSQGGSGLGLAIARGLVAAHGGSISVESVLGQGTVFEVKLPG